MTENVWDYPRPPRAEPTARHVVIRHAGQVVADTRRAVRVLETPHPPVYYIPPADVAAELRRTPRQTVCEFKGLATYWDVAGVVEAAWSYEEPNRGYESLHGLLAFYPSRFDECTVDGETVVAQPGDFYGGWLTSDITGPVKGGPGTLGW
jgi:uncharacterized protein (DUF427 family)